MTKKLIVQADLTGWKDMSEEDKQKTANSILKIVKGAVVEPLDDTPEEDAAGLKRKRDGYRAQEKRQKKKENSLD